MAFHQFPSIHITILSGLTSSNIIFVVQQLRNCCPIFSISRSDWYMSIVSKPWGTPVRFIRTGDFIKTKWFVIRILYNLTQSGMWKNIDILKVNHFSRIPIRIRCNLYLGMITEIIWFKYLQHTSHFFRRRGQENSWKRNIWRWDDTRSSNLLNVLGEISWTSNQNAHYKSGKCSKPQLRIRSVRMAFFDERNCLFYIEGIKCRFQFVIKVVLLTII